MVASAKMRRAQDSATNGRPYIAALAQVLYHLKDEIKEEAGVLMRKEATGKELVVVVTTDRGLCGGLNANLAKALRDKTPRKADVITFGKKLNTTIAKLGFNLVATWSFADPLEMNAFRKPIKFIADQFVEGKYDKVSVVYSEFINTMVQRPLVEEILPLTAGEILEVADRHSPAQLDTTGNPVFLLEPNPVELLDAILPLYFFYTFVQIMLESRASEHSARMVAMKSATENADSLVSELTLDFNKARQAQITNELLEITTSARSME